MTSWVGGTTSPSRSERIRVDDCRRDPDWQTVGSHAKVLLHTLIRQMIHEEHRKPAMRAGHSSISMPKK